MSSQRTMPMSGDIQRDRGGQASPRGNRTRDARKQKQKRRREQYPHRLHRTQTLIGAGAGKRCPNAANPHYLKQPLPEPNAKPAGKYCFNVATKQTKIVVILRQNTSRIYTYIAADNTILHCQKRGKHLEWFVETQTRNGTRVNAHSSLRARAGVDPGRSGKNAHSIRQSRDSQGVLSRGGVLPRGGAQSNNHSPMR